MTFWKKYPVTQEIILRIDQQDPMTKKLLHAQENKQLSEKNLHHRRKKIFANYIADRGASSAFYKIFLN